MNPTPSANVLVVDDEPSVLETIEAILTQEGYDVATAGSAEDALAVLRAHAQDLVLTDLRMEGASGLSLLSEVQRSWPHTVTVMLTGYASLESAVSALRTGAYDYLIKPCDVEELKATVARGVERSVLGRTLRERMEELDAANAKLRVFAEELQQRVGEATAELSQRVDELGAAKRGLEEAQRQREEFISMIAHELSQPLTTISGFAQLLSRDNLRTDVRERALGSIVGETRRLGRLVRDLADASRLSSGRFALEMVPCDLVEVVREEVEGARVAAQRHTLRLDAPSQSVPIVCDRDRVAQVLSNLLSNAMKYTPEGAVSVALRVEQKQAILAVDDDGPGVAADQLDSIFQPYVRLHSGSSGESPGTGLGLYIARGIIEAHRGRMWAELNERGGMRFAIQLPLSTTVPPEAVKGATASDGGS